MSTLQGSMPSAVQRPRRTYPRQSWASQTRSARTTPALGQVDVELDAAEQMLQLFETPATDQLSQRQNDRVGFRLEASRRACLLEQRFRNVEGGAHIITPLLYAQSVALRQPLVRRHLECRSQLRGSCQVVDETTVEMHSKHTCTVIVWLCKHIVWISGHSAGEQRHVAFS